MIKNHGLLSWLDMVDEVDYHKVSSILQSLWKSIKEKDGVSKESLLELYQLTLKMVLHKVNPGEDFKPLVKMLQDVMNRLQPYERTKNLDPSLLQEKAAALSVPDEDDDNFIITHSFTEFRYILCRRGGEETWKN